MFCFKVEGCPIIALHKGCKSAVKLMGNYQVHFQCKTCINQGSGLSPLLFIMVMNALTEYVRCFINGFAVWGQSYFVRGIIK